MNDVKFMRDTLYDLKKRHSAKIKIVEILRIEQSNRTGRRLVSKKTFDIKRAIRLPNDLKRSFVQDIAYLAANKNFTYGALNDYKTETFVIDARDLPCSYVPNLSHYLIYENQRYDLVDIGAGEKRVYLVYTAKQTMCDSPELTDTVTVLEENQSFDFAFGDAARIVFTMPRSGLIINTSIRYRTPFNSSSPTVVVGHNGNIDSLLKASESDPKETFEYTVDNDVLLNANDTVTLTIIPDGASAGAGVLTLELSFDL